jgi:Uma2 family endonuclease
MTLRPPFTPITAKLYRKLPEGPPYYQLIEGKLIMSPSPDFYHQTLSGRLYLELGLYLKQYPKGVVLYAPSDVFLDEINVFQPDLYYVSNRRRRVIAKGGVEGAPDLVVEILSPSTTRQDRVEKRRVYAQGGVKEMWIIDPKGRHIEIYSLRRGTDATPKIVRSPETFVPALFPSLEIDTAQLFKPV